MRGFSFSVALVLAASRSAILKTDLGIVRLPKLAWVRAARVSVSAITFFMMTV